MQWTQFGQSSLFCSQNLIKIDNLGYSDFSVFLKIYLYYRSEI
jgi:hypothetical protein